MITIKRTYVGNEQPRIVSGLWLKPVEGGYSLYLIDGGMVSPLKVVDDAGTPTDTSDDKARVHIEVSNIQALTTKQCNALNVGDQVVKKTGKMKHLYTVTYKEDKQGLCLSYIDAENAETVAYDWNGTSKSWEYTDTTITPLAG